MWAAGPNSRRFHFATFGSEDPTYGFSREQLFSVSHQGGEPHGFEDFWRQLKAKSDKFPMGIATEEQTSPDPAYRLLKVFYTVHPGFRVGAWAMCPQDPAQVRLGVVFGHGYGGRAEPEWDKAAPDRIVIFPVAPWFHLSLDPRLPTNDAARHVVHGIDSEDTYVLGACACALWRAVDVLESICPRPLEKFHYIGWSFGGGMGALMLPWEPRFSSAELGQPTFGNHPVRLQSECVGSGEAVRQLHIKRPEIEKTLGFFDAALAARHLRIPVVFACSTFDPAVPPAGQFSVANAHPGAKRISVFLTGHFDYAHENAREEERLHEENLRELIGEAACPGR
jgi:cephalosporin-C deacetylase